MDKCSTCGGDLVDQKCPVCNAGDEKSSEETESTEGGGGANMPTENEPAQQ